VAAAQWNSSLGAGGNPIDPYQRATVIMSDSEQNSKTTTTENSSPSSDAAGVMAHPEDNTDSVQWHGDEYVQWSEPRTLGTVEVLGEEVELRGYWERIRMGENHWKYTPRIQWRPNKEGRLRGHRSDGWSGSYRTADPTEVVRSIQRAYGAP
jgi:hypothetical protein